jgi:hypothetical protein
MKKTVCKWSDTGCEYSCNRCHESENCEGLKIVIEEHIKKFHSDIIQINLENCETV